MRKPNPESGSNSTTSPPHFPVGELGKSHPLLAAALANSMWEDGSKKRPAEILIHAFNRTLYATLRLRGTGYQVQVEVPEALLVYDALEAVLALENPPWEVNEYDKVVSSKKTKNT